jgi:hypothetical protein
MTDQEVGFIFEELHRSKSSLPPFESLSRPTLIRWNFDEPLSVVNCVIMGPKDVSIGFIFLTGKAKYLVLNLQAIKHEESYREGKKPEEVWGEEAANAVRKRRREAEEWVNTVY